MAVDFELEQKRRRAETVRKDLSRFKTEGGVFNYETLKSVGKLGSEGHIDRIRGPIATGKEADVFLGERGDKKVVIKIFRLSSGSYFRNPTVLQYIMGDKRFAGIKRTPRALIGSWALKEFRNLKKVEELGVNAPRPIALEKAVLVMQYIGEEKPAPRLLKCEMEDPEAMLKEIIAQMKKMHRGKFVHADVSEYNILVLKEKPYFIDFGQGVLLSHPKAEEFLERDVRNICAFFRKRGVECDPEEALKEVKSG